MNPNLKISPHEIEAGPAYAREACERYLEWHPECVSAMVYLGISLTKLAQYDEALIWFQKALDSDEPSWRPTILVELGKLHQRKGHSCKATDYFRDAAALKSEDASMFVNLGGCLARQGKLAEAEEQLRLGTICQKGCIDEAFLNLGHVLRSNRRYAEAIDCYKEALERDPHYEEAREALDDTQEAEGVSAI